MDLSRRAVLIGAVGFAGASALGACETSNAPAAVAQNGQYAWAINSKGFFVAPSTWTKVTYDQTLLNTTTARLLADGATWVFPTATASGIWQVLLNVAWDNAFSHVGARIAPKTHRKIVRFVQQNVGSPQVLQKVIPGASTDLTYHADLNEIGDQDVLTDGSKGYQQQQTNIQLGIRTDGADQRCWFEVYQDSAQPLMCRFDGSSVSQSEGRPPLAGIQAPSLMIAKMCDF